MHPASPVPGPLERAAQCGDQAGMLIADDQPDTGQTASFERSEETAPEHLVLAVPDIEAQHFSGTLGGDPVATTTAIEVTCEDELRTCR